METDRPNATNITTDKALHRRQLLGKVTGAGGGSRSRRRLWRPRCGCTTAVPDRRPSPSPGSITDVVLDVLGYYR
jgi:hypothetical protein